MNLAAEMGGYTHGTFFKQGILADFSRKMVLF
jgi:hypothetical protein